MMKKTMVFKFAAAALAAFVLANNCVDFRAREGPGLKFLAHRGLAQTFDIASVEWDTNTAAVIHEPEHPYIENTLPSMRAAFEYGADIVEFDIRVSKDGELAVFHDEFLDFRTEGAGRVSDYTMTELKKLDVGYGYTHDGGETFPLRGTGIGMMPAFDEVLEAFPEQEFLVHIRDGGIRIGEILLEKLDGMDKMAVARLSVYGNDEAIELIRPRYPRMKALSARMIKKAVPLYALVGWTGIVPRSLRNMEIHMPIEYARFLWGWPGRLADRLERANTRLVLTKKAGQWSGAFDTKEDLAEIPRGYRGYIWTERIDRVGIWMKER